MRFVITLLLLAGLTLGPSVPAHSYTLQLNSTATVQIRWPTTNINVMLSSSLTAPQGHIKAGSDVVGAAQRALRRWSEVSNVRFNIIPADGRQDVNPQNTPGDGVSLITVADTTINRGFFSSPFNPGRARVIFDPTSGAISESDIAINPNVSRFDLNGNVVQSFFSTDGTPGSYDLESTLVHEIGHMLGLEHTGIIGATMQPRQGANGTYNLPNLTTRTLSTDDVAGVRAVYGPRGGLGSISGTVTVGNTGVFGAHVWAEEVTTGRAYAGNVTLPNGNYRIDSLPAGQYRLVVEPLDEPVAAREIASRSGAYQGLQTTTPLLRTLERTDPVTVAGDVSLNISMDGQQPFLNPKFIGINSQLSTVAPPVVPGATGLQVFVGGDNVNIANVAGVGVTSPYFAVVPGSLQSEGVFGTVPVISFRIDVSVLAAPGEYSVRLVSTTGEVAYVSGGLTVDVPFGMAAGGANLIDDAQFFVAQHYRDFLNREPDQSGLNFWTNQITSCGSDVACREVRRINVSAAFFLSIEFQQTGYLVYRAYHAAFGDRVAGVVPVTIQEFLPDTQRLQRGVVVGQGNWQQQLEANKQAYFAEFVARPDFVALYPANLSPEEYVDRLNANTGGALSQAERDALVQGLRQGTETRASVLRKVAEDPDEERREFNRAFVLIEYFGYLRRNPNDPPEPGLDFRGYNFWLGKLNQFGGDYIAAEMVKAFILSTEYRSRFGPA